MTCILRAWNDMKLLYIYLTYNRPTVLNDCLRTTLGNTSIAPNEAWILDDCSEPQIQADLARFAISNRNHIQLNLVLNQKNFGIGYQFEMAYQLMKMKNPEYVFFIESDYIFRQEYMEDCMAVFEANPNCIAIPGTSHPDMYNREKTHTLFPNLMREQFPEDVEGREHMYKPFQLETSRGKISVQGASNSCGCHIFAWKRFQQLMSGLGQYWIMDGEFSRPIDSYWAWMERAFNKHENGDRRYASDQHLSSTLTWYWYEWAKLKGLDLTVNFPWLDICDSSIGQHLCALGINGHLPGIKEGQTFVGSPVWLGEKFSRETLNK